MSKRLVSIVVPSLNESLTIGEFVAWAKIGLQDAGVDGQILIIDSSSDNTPDIARSAGATVIAVKKRGLGQAYIDAIPHISGDYVIMGDCDLTYDFRSIRPFIERLDQGYEFVMGTRARGYIEKGAMPALHRYFGIPVTTFILNLMYGTRFSDIHCGMRALTLDALKKMDLESGSWEYASEMVLKSAQLGLKTVEVPIRFYKDKAGRISHHKRLGWFSPWFAGWINLKIMFLYLPSFFLLVPGYVLTCAGLALTFSVILGPVRIGNIAISLHGMLLGMTLTVLGYSAAQMGILSKFVYDFKPERSMKYRSLFSYEKGVIAGGLLMISGLAIAGNFVLYFIRNGCMLSEISRPVIAGLLLIILGFQTFTFTLLLNMIVRKNDLRRQRAGEEAAK